MQVAVETLTTREKRRDLRSPVFDQKLSLDDARCHVGCPQHGGVRRRFAAPGYAACRSRPSGS